MKRATCLWIVATSLLLALTLSAFSQVATTGQIVGTMQDPSGAVIPGVEVQVQNEETKAVHRVVSGADGGFVFSPVPPGDLHPPGDVARFRDVCLFGNYRQCGANDQSDGAVETRSDHRHRQRGGRSPRFANDHNNGFGHR